MSMTVLLCLGTLSAQELGERVRERIEAAKVAYITKRMNLTAEESSRFWAIHNEFDLEQRRIRQRMRTRGKLESMSDAEVESALEEEFEDKQRLLDLEKTYYKKYKAILSARKVALFYEAEKDFRLELLEKAREQRSQRGRRPGGFRQ